MVRMEGYHHGSETLTFGDDKRCNVDPVKSDWSNDIKHVKLVCLFPFSFLFSLLSISFFYLLSVLELIQSLTFLLLLSFYPFSCNPRSLCVGILYSRQQIRVTNPPSF